MTTIETLPLGEEIIQLSATRLEAERWRPPLQTKTLRELVTEHAQLHAYTAESAGELGQDLLAELGCQVIDLYFQNKDARENEKGLTTARLDAAEEARERLEQIADEYRGSRLKVVALDGRTNALFRQTNIDDLNPRGKEYREAIGKINSRTFTFAHSLNLTMPGFFKRLGGSNELRVSLFRPSSMKPQVKLELVD